MHLASFTKIVLLLSCQFFSEAAQDEEPKHGEVDGNEMPLGKMLKSLKSKGGKAKKVKKVKKDKSLRAEVKNAENDVDILKMVREINYDNLGMSTKFESSNGHEHVLSKKIKMDPKLGKGKKRIAGDATSVPVPKRRRSSSAHSAFRSPTSTSKAPLRASGDDLNKARVSSFQSIEMDPDTSPDTKDKMSMRKKKVARAESDLLVSCIRKNTSFSSKHKDKLSNQGHNDEVNEEEEANEHDTEVSSATCQYVLGVTQT
jgi:sister-chromatid-cohesion protein PDS5